MKIALIPARGGSKRIPRKNIRLFHGKPIIAYSIEAACRSGLFDRVIVSTDDEEIASTARDYGAETPFLRPKPLADDDAGTGAVIQHALDWLAENDAEPEYLCTIYATAPLISEDDLAEGLSRLQASDAVHAISTTSMPYPIQRAFRITAAGRIEMFQPENFHKKSQDLEPGYHDAGQFYWTHLGRQRLAGNRISFSEISIPIVMPRHRVLDIDTEEDWIQAELLFEAFRSRHKN
ncbi:pseudaminic acid cytidylyltransferase [Guyparkeria halophila]|uniref:pseudaminic acid cytidylyltransferase n=1 Tax=Guyparkeria halophila TaxID=47960 RepID=UPI0018CBF246|nr:pseudaminic acid cytidylyltransferase [Guyparkeria halophila]